MKARHLALAFTVLLLAVAPLASAHDGEKVGSVRFPVSCAPAVQADFERAVALLHSFWYEKAMAQLFARYPDDREAAVFYALALNATAAPTDKTYANQLKAAAILEKVLAEQPNHPGIAHYLIHSYDYPPLATRGLAAARSYAKVAPAVPHAQHMPAHIFTRLGLWQESIDSNRASADAGKAYYTRLGKDTVWDQTLHALDYVVYAHLQVGQDKQARAVLEELSAMQKSEPESFVAAYAYAAIPARAALEQHRWSDAAAVTPASAAFPWEKFAWAQAITSFTRAVGAARSGDAAKARAEVQKLDGYRTALVAAKQTYWAEQVNIQQQAAAAWAARAEGKNDEALRLMRAAADLEDSRS